MKKSEATAELFLGGYNCAASVLSSFCENYDLDAETAARLACGLGGGCNEGEICGAVSAAVLVVGLKYGQSVQGDMGTKANCYARTKQFMDAFRERHGAVTCQALLESLKGLSDEETAAHRRDLCVSYVKGAVDILDEFGY